MGDGSFTKRGETLIPGHNVDAVNVDAGLQLAEQFGHDDPKSIMVLSYALNRHSRGEEAHAERAVLSGGISLTSWKAILAAGIAAAPVEVGEPSATFFGLCASGHARTSARMPLPKGGTYVALFCPTCGQVES